MQFEKLEQIFNRSARLSFTKKKLFFTFPIVMVCGILTLLCRTLAMGAGDWIVLSLSFLPCFLCSGVLLAAGVILIRLYHNQVKLLPLSIKGLLEQSWETMLAISYLAVPLILTYLLLWVVLGIFYFLKEIPGVGQAVGVLLSFGPFLLVLGSLLLALSSLALLFFVTPAVALKTSDRKELFGEVWGRMKNHAFSYALLFGVALLPFCLCGGLLWFAAHVTKTTFCVVSDPLAMAVQWLLILFPFSALLSPSIIFFFNFSAESFVFLKRRAPDLEEMMVP